MNGNELVYTGHKHDTSDITALDSYIRGIASSSGGNCKISASSYVGNGVDGQKITTSIRPYYVILYNGYKTASSYINWNIVNSDIKITYNGFIIYNSNWYGNSNVYHYLVFGV